MDFSSLSNYDTSNIANSENVDNTLSSLNLQKNLVAKQLKEAKGSSYLEIGGLSEMVVPTLLKRSGLTNLSLDDFKTVASDLTSDIDVSSVLSAAQSNISNLFKSETTNNVSEDIPMETFSNMSKQTIFESPEIENPVYDPTQLDKVEPMTEDLTSTLAKSETSAITEDVAKTTVTDTLETVGEGIGEAALTVATDGVGTLVSGLLGVAGLAGGAYSFYEGFRSLFDHPARTVINYVPQATGDFVAN
jgi:hypothetical protein